MASCPNCAPTTCDWISLSSTGSAPIRIIEASSSASLYVLKLPEITACPSDISSCTAGEERTFPSYTIYICFLEGAASAVASANFLVPFALNVSCTTYSLFLVISSCCVPASAFLTCFPEHTTLVYCGLPSSSNFMSSAATKSRVPSLPKDSRTSSAFSTPGISMEIRSFPSCTTEDSVLYTSARSCIMAIVSRISVSVGLPLTVWYVILTPPARSKPSLIFWALPL